MALVCRHDRDRNGRVPVPAPRGAHVRADIGARVRAAGASGTLPRSPLNGTTAAYSARAANDLVLTH